MILALATVAFTISSAPWLELQSGRIDQNGDVTIIGRVLKTDMAGYARITCVARDRQGRVIDVEFQNTLGVHRGDYWKAYVFFHDLPEAPAAIHCKPTDFG